MSTFSGICQKTKKWENRLQSWTFQTFHFMPKYGFIIQNHVWCLPMISHIEINITRLKRTSWALISCFMIWLLSFGISQISWWNANILPVNIVFSANNLLFNHFTQYIANTLCYGRVALKLLWTNVKKYYNYHLLSCFYDNYSTGNECA